MCKHHLKASEESEQAKAKEPVPPPHMMESLDKYLLENGLLKYTSRDQLEEKIGGAESQYYNLCYQIAKVMLVREYEKRHCVIVYGTAGSGKTKFAKFM